MKKKEEREKNKKSPRRPLPSPRLPAIHQERKERKRRKNTRGKKGKKVESKRSSTIKHSFPHVHSSTIVEGEKKRGLQGKKRKEGEGGYESFSYSFLEWPPPRREKEKKKIPARERKRKKRNGTRKWSRKPWGCVSSVFISI